MPLSDSFLADLEMGGPIIIQVYSPRASDLIAEGPHHLALHGITVIMRA